MRVHHTHGRISSPRPSQSLHYILSLIPQIPLPSHPPSRATKPPPYLVSTPLHPEPGSILSALARLSVLSCPVLSLRYLYTAGTANSPSAKLGTFKACSRSLTHGSSGLDDMAASGGLRANHARSCSWSTGSGGHCTEGAGWKAKWDRGQTTELLFDSRYE